MCIGLLDSKKLICSLRLTGIYVITVYVITDCNMAKVDLMCKPFSNAPYIHDIANNMVAHLCRNKTQDTVDCLVLYSF